MSNEDISFSLSDFKTRIGGIVRPNLWYAEIITPTAIEMPDFSFRCEASTLPGKTIATVDDVGSGPALKLPYDINFNDIELTIICSDDMAERKAFEDWTDRIVDITGRVGYHDDYAKNKMLHLTQMNEKGKKLIKYTFFHVFPIQISPMNLSWEETNTYQRFTVTLSYRYHIYT